MCYLVLLPVPEEYMLPFSCVRKRVVVRVREHDRFLSFLAFGNDFRRVLVDASLFPQVLPSLFRGGFPRRMVVDEV